MRFIIYGVGAIGGTIAAGLALDGKEVVGIARGRQLEILQKHGLTYKTPSGTDYVRFDTVGTPAEIDFRADDVILLCMKSQDTEAALIDLRAAGVSHQPVVCAQNGVANERTALRYFANVYGATVLMPSNFITPGEIVSFASPRAGILDIGRYPAGSDATVEAIAAELDSDNLAAFVQGDVMANKYGKLLLNLGNIVGAACGEGLVREIWTGKLMNEAKAVLKAAGIAWADVGFADPRRDELMRYTHVEGMKRTGSSSLQSLMRGTGSIETDYLNGEIVLLGRLHSVPTPANAYFCELAQQLVRKQIRPGSVSDEEVAAAIAARRAG